MTWRGLRNSVFARSVLMLVSASALGQLISFAVYPFISRIYSVEDFGLFGLFQAVSATIAVPLTGRYELAIPLPKTSIKAISLGLLVLYFSIVGFLICCVAAFVILITGHQFFFGPGLWLCVGLFVVFNGLTQVWIYWSTRKGTFKQQSMFKISQAVLAAAVVICPPIWTLGGLGLVCGNLFSYAGSLFIFQIRSLKRNISHILTTRPYQLKRSLVFYRDFLLFAAPTALVNSISVNVVTYFLSFTAGSEAIGYYSLANRVLNAPLTMLALSFGPVFHRSYISHPSRQKFFLRSIYLGLAIGLLYSLPFVFFGEQIFSIFFGEKWAICGRFARVLVPYLVSAFVVTNVGSVVLVHQRNSVALAWQIAYLVIICCTLFFARNSEIATSLLAFSLVGCAMFLFYGVLLFKMCR